MSIESEKRQIKKILKDNLFKREILSTRGKINFNRLARHKTSKYLFSNPSQEKGKRYNIEILLDCSGSMQIHDRMEPATDACKTIVDLLKSVSNLGITLFNYVEKRIDINNFKPEDYLFGERGQTASYGYKTEEKNGVETITIDKDDFLSYGEEGERDDCNNGAGAGNWEIINLANTCERLRKQEGKKIIILLTDGSPNLDRHSRNSKYTDGRIWKKDVILAGRNLKHYPKYTYQKQVKSILRKDIDLITIGIGTNDPENFYPNFYKCDYTSDIGRIMIESLSKIIK